VPQHLSFAKEVEIKVHSVLLTWKSN